MTRNKNLKADSNPINLAKAIDYVRDKDRRVVFKAMMYTRYNKAIEAYVAGGHILTRKILKGLKSNAIQETKEALKAKVEVAAAPAEQNQKESEGLLQEG